MVVNLVVMCALYSGVFLHIEHAWVVIDLKDSSCLVPTDTGQLPCIVHGKVEANDEFGVIVKAVDHRLSVAVPNEGGHVVAATCQNIRVKWRELHSAHCQCMLSQHHDGLVRSCSQVPHLHCVVSGTRRNEVLILVKVHGKDFVHVTVDALDIFARSEIPNAGSLIATAATKNRFVSGVPHCCIHSEIVAKHALRLPTLHRICIPDLYLAVLGS